jgi:rubrerythrin
MEALKRKILDCLLQKLHCYQQLIIELNSPVKEIFQEIVEQEHIQYNSVKQIFETSQCTVSEEAIPGIEHLSDVLLAYGMKDSKASDYVKCAMQAEKVHYRLFSLIAQHNQNRLTAEIFKNFAQELASHTLILDQLSEE